MLGEFLESNKEDEDQGNSEAEQASVKAGKRAEEGEVEQEGQDPVEGEVSNLVAGGNPIEETKNGKLPPVSQNDDTDDEKCEGGCDVFQAFAPNFSVLCPRRAFHHSKNIGMTEMRMMATMTSSKFFLTNARLPKKYPSKVKSVTHTAPPTIL